MIQTIRYNSRSCYRVMQNHTRSVQQVTIQRSYMSVRQPFLYRTETKTKDILKSLEEKKSIDTKLLKNSVKSTTDAKSTAAVKKTMWQKVKQEAVHYWHGFKLLGLETSISSRLVYKLLQGKSLSRRENRQVNKRGDWVSTYFRNLI